MGKKKFVQSESTTPGSLDCLLLRANEDHPIPKTIEDLLFDVVDDESIVEILPPVAKLFLVAVEQMPSCEWKREFVYDFSKLFSSYLKKSKEV